MDCSAASKKYLTTAEVALLLRCSRAHVTNLAKSRKLEAVYAGHRLLVPESALDDFIQRGKTAPQVAIAA
jgi:excisionase family DNA binding protein